MDSVKFDLAAPRWDDPRLRPFVQAGLLHRNAAQSDVVKGCGGRLCYLATPYSKVTLRDYDGEWCPSASMEAARNAGIWARSLSIDGVTAISPIIQAVEMIHTNFSDWLDPLDFEFWEDWSHPLLCASGPVIVPPIEGWAESLGIWREAVFALERNRPVYLIDQTQAPKISRWGDD
jgi:hypothetical protein